MKSFFNKNPFFKKNLFFLRNRTLINKKIIKPYDTRYDSISCGSLLAVKNIDLIIDVVAGLKSYFPNYIHAHAGMNGNMFEKLLKKVKQCSLEKNFLFLGELRNLDEFYSSGEIFIHASKNEGTPNALMEAMSFGLPIISSKWGDVDHFVFNEKNGSVIESRDPKIWVRQIKRFYLKKKC